MRTSDLKRLGEAYRQIVESSENPLEEKKKLDPVNDKENDKKFKDRKDKDIDNDGDVDSSDEYLHKRRAATDDAIDGGKKPAKKEDKGQFAFVAQQAKKKGDKEFVFAGKKYKVDSPEVEEALKEQEEGEPCPVCGKVHGDEIKHDKEDVKEAKSVKEEEDEEEENPVVPAKDVKKKKKDDEEEDEDEGDESDADSEDDSDDKEEKPADDKGDGDIKKNPKTADKKAEISKIESVKVKEAFDDFWNAFEGLQEKRKESQGATDPEGLTDKESPKSKEFIAKHNVETTDEEDEIKKKNGKEDGGVKPKSGKRPQDSTVGEAKSLVDLAREVLSGDNPNAFQEMKGDGLEDISKKDKSEKNPYDGRTKEARAFLERMAKARGK